MWIRYQEYNQQFFFSRRNRSKKALQIIQEIVFLISKVSLKLGSDLKIKSIKKMFWKNWWFIVLVPALIRIRIYKIRRIRIRIRSMLIHIPGSKRSWLTPKIIDVLFIFTFIKTILLFSGWVRNSLILDMLFLFKKLSKRKKKELKYKNTFIEIIMLWRITVGK